MQPGILDSSLLSAYWLGDLGDVYPGSSLQTKLENQVMNRPCDGIYCCVGNVEAFQAKNVFGHYRSGSCSCKTGSCSLSI